MDVTDKLIESLATLSTRQDRKQAIYIIIEAIAASTPADNTILLRYVNGELLSREDQFEAKKTLHSIRLKTNELLSR